MGKQVDEFFTVSEKEFENKRTVTKEGKKTKVAETYTESKQVCHVKSASDYINHLIKQRGLDPTTALIRVGIDGGGGSLKLCVSVIDPAAFDVDVDKDDDDTNFG